MLLKQKKRIILFFVIFLLNSTIVFARTGHDILGVYKGAASLSVPGKIANFEAWLGRPVDYVLDFQARDSWAQIEGPAWQIGNDSTSWEKTNYKDRLVLSVALLPDNPADATLAKGASGEYDNHFIKLAENLRDNGMPNTILRLGWEMNGGWYKWTATNGKETDFANYFKRIVTAMRSVPGHNLKFVWNPCVGENADLVKCYPGDEYVDYIGLDIYDQSWAKDTYPIPHDASSAERFNRWVSVWSTQKVMKWGLNWFVNFAKEHNKPLCVPEWGVNTRNDGHGGGDNPYFIQWMHDWMKANDIAWHIYFDYKDSKGTNDHLLSEADKTKHPDAAGRFRELWQPLPNGLISHEKPATASSVQSGNSIHYANDGSSESRWAAEANSYPQWWKVDLGKIYNLSGVDISWLSSSSRAYKYKIEVSNDDIEYTVKVDKTSNVDFGDTSDIVTGSARYVRVTITGCSESSGFASFYECKVFGSPVPVDVSNLKCYSGEGSEFYREDMIPASDNIRISGSLVKDPDAILESNQLKFITALYGSNHRLIDCDIINVDFDENLQTEVEMYLKTPSDTTGCYIKALLWNSSEIMSPCMPSIYLPN